MDILKNMLLPPGVEHLQMLPVLVVFMLWAHLPFAGIAWICNLLSLVFWRRDPAAARDLGRVAPITWSTISIFVVLPLASLLFLFQHYLYGETVPVGSYILRLALPIILGFLLLALGQRRRQAALVAAGSVLLAGGYFFFSSVMNLIFTPEKWPFIRRPMPDVFSVTVVVHFKVFCLVSVLLAGAAILFVLFRWPEKRLPADAPHAETFRRMALAMVAGGCLLLPAFMIWELYVAPEPALSLNAFWLSALVLVLLAALAIWSVTMLGRPASRWIAAAFVGALAVSGLLILKDHSLQAAANQEHWVLLNESSARALAEWQGQRAAELAKNMVVDDKLGEKIYNDRCTACHRFDQKVVGPPYNQVLPKYAGDVEKLKTFLRNPVKVDAAYPAMPNQGLTELEVASVATYLLKKYDEGK